MTQPITTALNSLRRPRLLIRAARFGLTDYNRTQSLRRIFTDARPDAQANPLPPLIDEEALHEARRATGDASYSVARHVEILIALMSEAQRALYPQANT